MSGNVDDTLTGRSDTEYVHECAREHTVRGVELPGDVGVFVRDDTLDDGDPANPTVAGWRCQREAVAVTVYPTATDVDGEPAPDATYVADIRRWSPRAEMYVFDTIIAARELDRLPPMIRAALRFASGDMHTFAGLCEFAESFETDHREF